MPSERILVVDDDPAILTLCQRILTSEGYVVVEAKRGDEALAKLESESFDLLLTDIRLPGLNGLEVTQRLRDRGLELTVITMTGYSNMEMAIQALSLGVDEFLVKPFTLDSLRITVSRALEKSRLRRENLRLNTLLPLLLTAQSLATARTREHVYENLFNAVRALFKCQELAFAELSADLQLLTFAAGAGGAMSQLRDQVFYAAQFADANEIFAGLQVWDETQTPRLPLSLDRVNWVVAMPLRARERTLGILLAALPNQPSRSNLDALHLIVAHAAATLENVSLLGEISRAYINARELERLKSEFINIAGHEIRTPLAVLRGYASLLNDKLTGDVKEYAAQVVTQAERLQRIADDILNLNYLGNGHIELRLEQCPVDQVMREVVNAYRPLAMEREQSIEMEIPARAGQVMADRAMLDLMLGSLISNAIKFSPRQTRVRVAADGDERQVTLQVQDEGKGIPSGQMDHVFDAFYQASNSLTRAEGGLGLGLTITREMVRAHGGRIWVESEQNAGTSFYISLPREIPQV